MYIVQSFSRFSYNSNVNAREFLRCTFTKFIRKVGNAFYCIKYSTTEVGPYKLYAVNF